MFLSIASTAPPARDLGYLLFKHPDRLQSFDLGWGQARVFYPEASDERCTAALLVEIDPIGLARRARPGGSGDFALGEYVNDRPYVASSLLAVAIGQVFRSALTGECGSRPDLAATPLPLQATIGVVRAGPGERLLRYLFEPLGYTLSCTRPALDARFPSWGASPYVRLELSGVVRLSELLRHLYVLLPVIDDQKHYWIDEEETKKLLHRGEGWLAAHPARDLILRRYLKHQANLVDVAKIGLGEGRRGMEELSVGESDPAGHFPLRSVPPSLVDPPRLSLHQQRIEAVAGVLVGAGAKRVLDLGCGEGKLLQWFQGDARLDEVVGVDVSLRALEKAKRRLRLDAPETPRTPAIFLKHGSLLYLDRGLVGYDAAALVEVVEHLDPERLRDLERVVFGALRPRLVALTTPNADYNVRYVTLRPGALRHGDHRFEWGRAAFAEWVRGVATRNGYAVEIAPVGPLDAEVGAPSQMGVFRRCT